MFMTLEGFFHHRAPPACLYLHYMSSDLMKTRPGSKRFGVRVQALRVHILSAIFCTVNVNFCFFFFADLWVAHAASGEQILPTVLQ